MSLTEMFLALEQSQEAKTPETTNSALMMAEETCQKSTEQRNSTIHFFLAEEGCMGKSVSAGWFSQALNNAGRKIVVIDADPSKDTLAQFTALNVRRFTILDSDEEFDVAAMDVFIEEMMESDCDFVVDFGARGFPYAASYFKRDDVINFIAESGKDVCIHTFVVGGERQDNTVKLARAFLNQMPKEVQLVLWINPKFGKLRHESEFSNYFSERGVHIIRIPDAHAGSLGNNLEFVLESRLTFSEAVKKGDLPLIAKNRLLSFWSRLSDNINNAIGS